VVRAWDLGSGPVAFMGYAFERTKHLSGMGPVSLVPTNAGREPFPTTPGAQRCVPLLATVWYLCEPGCSCVAQPLSLVPRNVGSDPELKIHGNRLVGVYPVSFLLDLLGVCILPCV
jgi:hypothetical protein